MDNIVASRLFGVVFEESSFNTYVPWFVKHLRKKNFIFFRNNDIFFLFLNINPIKKNPQTKKKKTDNWNRRFEKKHSVWSKLPHMKKFFPKRKNLQIRLPRKSSFLGLLSRRSWSKYHYLVCFFFFFFFLHLNCMHLDLLII